MRQLRRAVLAVAALVVLTPTAPAQAAAIGCTSSSPVYNWLNPSGFNYLTVTGAMGGAMPFPACPLGPGVMTWADQCGTTLFEHTVRGAYCGIVIGPGETADCAWDHPLPNGSALLVVGFDANFDGHIAGETMTVPFDNNHYVKNPHPYDVRLIGFPVSLSPTIYPVHHFLVGCWQ